MTCLILGGTGQTGRLLARQLLDRGEAVRAIVRSADRLPADVRDHPDLTVITADVLDLEPPALAEAAEGCCAVASCLGHTLSARGMFAPPYRLVTEAVRRLGDAASAGAAASPDGPPVRLVLMNTVGVRDPAEREPRSLVEHAIFGVLRLLLPPHADNEQAAAALRRHVDGLAPAVEWSAVRPEGLTDADAVTEYRVDGRLQQSPLFGSRKVSRINVAHFMAELMTSDETWRAWRGRMPVIGDAAPA